MNYSVNVKESVDENKVTEIVKKMEEYIENCCSYRSYGSRLRRINSNYGVDVILYFYSDRDTEYPFTAVEGLTRTFQGVEYYLHYEEQALAVRLPAITSSDVIDVDTIALRLAYIIFIDCYPITFLDDDDYDV